MNQYRSSLAAIVGRAGEPSDANARRAARDAYHRNSIVLISLEWLPQDEDRQRLINLADKVHGKRPCP